MNLYINVQDSTIEIPTNDALGTRILAPGESFFGSTFYDRYIGMGLLAKMSAEIVTQRGFVSASDIDTTANPARFKAQSGTAGVLYAINQVVTGGTAFAANTVDIEGTLGGVGQFVQITTDQDVVVRINENSNSDFTLVGGTTQVYNPGDINIATLQFDATFSGAVTASVDIQASTSNIPSSKGKIKYTLNYAFDAEINDPVLVTYYFYTDQINAGEATHIIKRIEKLGAYWTYPTWASLPSGFANLSPEDQKSALLATV